MLKQSTLCDGAFLPTGRFGRRSLLDPLVRPIVEDARSIALTDAYKTKHYQSELAASKDDKKTTPLSLFSVARRRLAKEGIELVYQAEALPARRDGQSHWKLTYGVRSVDRAKMEAARKAAPPAGSESGEDGEE